jgi:hypothetical protein
MHRPTSYNPAMKLEQGQVWKKENEHFRIVKWSRETIVYKVLPAPETKGGTQQTVTKKEFCRLIKGAELL